MKKLIALLMTLIMILGLVACDDHAQDNRVVVVPAPEGMTREFLQEHAKEKGHHEWEGDIYLMEPYVFAVREDGEIVCIADGVMDVLSVSSVYQDAMGILQMDGILLVTTYGILEVGNSREGWNIVKP